jgi:hypothetical protein
MTKKRFRVNMFKILPLLLYMTAIPTALILLFIYVAGKYSFGDDNILFAASMVVAFATNSHYIISRIILGNLDRRDRNSRIKDEYFTRGTFAMLYSKRYLHI